MPVYTPATPDRQQVLLRILDAEQDITRWTSYSFSSNYLTPADGWSFTIGDGELDDAQKEALRVGSRVRLYVDNYALGDGIIDRIEINADRSRGITYGIHGRDRLGLVVDSVADPRLQFKTGTTLAEFLKTTLSPYGWSEDTDFTMDASANRDAKTGGVRGAPLPKRKSKTGKLSQFQIYQLKPHNHEGLFRFIMRTVERFGLYVQVSADGNTIIVAAPDFEQEPKYQLVRDYGRTNILSGSVVYDATDQPSVIIVDGFSNTPEFGRGRLKAYCVNPFFGVDADGKMLASVAKILEPYSDAVEVKFANFPYRRRAPLTTPKPMFLHDEESKTQDQLNWFVKRTMSELLKKSLVCHYEVEGHGQMRDGVFIPWDVDTVVDVQDEVAGVIERMYVLGRTFEKSRQGGTTTKLELIRLYSIAGHGAEALDKIQAKFEQNNKPGPVPEEQYEYIAQSLEIISSGKRDPTKLRDVTAFRRNR